MSRFIIFLVLLTGLAAQEIELNQYLWKNRVLLVFPGSASLAQREQAEIIASDPDGLNERDLVVVLVDDQATMKRYKVTPGDFTVILLGKDGGEKLRQSQPLKLKDLYPLIDSMPMRQREMRE